MCGGLNKTAIEINGLYMDKDTRGYFESDANKSGRPTMTRLRFGALREALLCLVRELFCRPHDGVHLQV